MILVTGATGLLGMHVVYSLALEGNKIRALYRNPEKIEFVNQLIRFYSPEQSEVISKSIEWFHCDIEDLVQLEDAFDSITDVYHCAAVVSFTTSDFSGMMETNRTGTANVVNIAIEKKIRKLCHVSSTAAVGKSSKNNHDIVVEANKWEQSVDTSGYAITKYSAEKEVWRGIEEGLNAVIVNPCVILGPGNWNESSLTLFRTIHKGLHFYPPGANAIVDVRDVVSRMRQLMNMPISSERFLIIGKNLSFKELFDVIATRMGKKTPKFSVQPWMMGIAWRIASVYSFITGKPASLSRQTASSAFSTTRYSTDKIDAILPIPYFSLEEAVDNTIRFHEFQLTK
jgi:dihydroflavonol-4-reductase